MKIYIYNSTGALKGYDEGPGPKLSLNVTLQDGIYYMNATVTDMVGLFENTSTKTITLDTTAPVFVSANPSIVVIFLPSYSTVNIMHDKTGFHPRVQYKPHTLLHRTLFSSR